MRRTLYLVEPLEQIGARASSARIVAAGGAPLDECGSGPRSLWNLQGVQLSAIEAHLAHLARLNRRPGTIYQRRRALARLAAFVGERDLLDLDVEDLRAFTARRELAVETTAAETNHLIAFYRWAMLEELIFSDPSLRLERPSRPRRLPRPMPDADVDRALIEAPDPIQAWLYLAAYAGLRACEIGPLRGEDLRHDLIVIREQKGGDQGVVALAPALRPILARYPQSGWLFPSGRHADEPVSAGQVQRRANRWLHDSGIEHTLHTLRHWFGTNVLRSSGRDLRLTQELMRHKSIQSTVGYTQLLPDDGARAVSQLRVVGH